MKMLKVTSVLSICSVFVLLAGCSTDTTTNPGTTGTGTESTNSTEMTSLPADLGAPEGQSEENTETPAIPAGAIVLNGENTTIEFVGSHVVEEKPDPMARHGQFKELDGHAVVEGGLLKSIEIAINTASLDTGNEKLNAHLNNSDFFNTNEYPKATFVTTSIAPADGKMMITGDLTLLETTKSVTFPAKVMVQDGKLTLEAEFEIDRTEYGINFDPAKVEKAVPLTIKIDA